MNEKFEIRINGMVYIFEEDQLAEIMDLLDYKAIDAYSELLAVNFHKREADEK